MITRELLDYIKQQLQAGNTPEAVKSALLSQGWTESDIHGAFAGSGIPNSTATPAPFVSASGLLKASFAVYKRRFKTFIGIELVLLALVLAGIGLGLIWRLSGIKNILIAVVGAVPFFIAFIYLALWTQVAALFAIKDREEAIGVKESFRRSRGLMGAYFWLNILSGMVIMGGLILLIVPGIIMSVLFSVSAYVFVSEGQRGILALMKSRDYVRGRWGAVLWRWIVLGIVILLVYVPFLLLSAVQQTLGNVLAQAAMIFITPFAMVFGMLLYENLRSTRPEIAAAAPAGKKTKYVIIAIVGPLLIPLILVFAGLNSARSKSRDARRISDVRQLQTSLESYYLDKNQYPVRLEDLAPDYLGSIPRSPTPTDGACTAALNEYSYTRSRFDGYSIRFCIGGSVGSMQGGVHMATEEGLDNMK